MMMENVVAIKLTNYWLYPNNLCIYFTDVKGLQYGSVRYPMLQEFEPRKDFNSQESERRPN